MPIEYETLVKSMTGRKHPHAGRPGKRGGSAPSNAAAPPVAHKPKEVTHPDPDFAKYGSMGPPPVPSKWGKDITDAHEAAYLYTEHYITAKKISAESRALITGEKSPVTGMEKEAAHLLEGIRTAPEVNKPLYRSVSFGGVDRSLSGDIEKGTNKLEQFLNSAQVGQTLSLDRISSFSSDESHAAYYTVPKHRYYRIKLEGPVKAVDMDQYTRASHKEFITQGKFKVLRVERPSKVESSFDEDMGEEPRTVSYYKTIVLQQTGIY